MAAREPELGADVHVLIMAGGSGTRFWPRSRAWRPKQLLPLWDEKSLLRHTVERFVARGVAQPNIWVVTAEALLSASRAALGDEYREVRFLGEPLARNTAPCILWGLTEIQKVAPGGVVAVMPADSYIGDGDALAAALSAAVGHARSAGALVTVGVQPTRAETGYGYIEVEARVGDAKGQPRPVPVLRFVEKPDSRAAVEYVDSGRYLWNAGMFIFTVESGLAAFRSTMPELGRLFASGESAERLYPRIRKEDAISIDYGVMEKAAGRGIPVAVVPTACGWNDVGSFTALEEIDCSTLGEVVSLESSGNIVQTDQGLVALLGVNDLVVVRDGDVVLVAAKGRAQDIKALVEKVRKNRPEAV